MIGIPLGERSSAEPVPACFIPNRFEDALFAHLVGNALNLRSFPLILGIHGPSGHGKSFQCTVLLQRWGVVVRPISGSQMENRQAGGPSRVLKEEYKAAHDTSTIHGRASCLLIDDIDAGIGDFGNDVTYTVNRQNTSAALMNLCDHPSCLDGNAVQRTPIVVTANALVTLYAPLIRHQRMTLFYWETTVEERIKIAMGILDGILEPECAKALVEQFPSEPPSFFSQVVSECVSAALLQMSRDRRRDELLRELLLSPRARDEIVSQIRTDGTATFEGMCRSARGVHEERCRLHSIAEGKGNP